MVLRAMRSSTPEKSEKAWSRSSGSGSQAACPGQPQAAPLGVVAVPVPEEEVEQTRAEVRRHVDVHVAFGPPLPELLGGEDLGRAAGTRRERPRAAVGYSSIVPGLPPNIARNSPSAGSSGMKTTTGFVCATPAASASGGITKAEAG